MTHEDCLYGVSKAEAVSRLPQKSMRQSPHGFTS